MRPQLQYPEFLVRSLWHPLPRACRPQYRPKFSPLAPNFPSCSISTPPHRLISTSRKTLVSLQHLRDKGKHDLFQNVCPPHSLPELATSFGRDRLLTSFGPVSSHSFFSDFLSLSMTFLGIPAVSFSLILILFAVLKVPPPPYPPQLRRPTRFIRYFFLLLFFWTTCGRHCPGIFFNLDALLTDPLFFPLLKPRPH